jgi:hypothetical protein
MPNTKPPGTLEVVKALMKEFSDGCYQCLDELTEEDKKDPEFVKKIEDKLIPKLYDGIKKYNWGEV